MPPYEEIRHFVLKSRAVTWLVRLLALGVFGALGAICRYLVGISVVRFLPEQPWLGTFVANATGCFLFGLVFQLAFYGNLITEPWRLLLLTGFLGAFTTFSAYAFDGMTLFERHGLLAAAGYLLLQNTAGIFMAWAGVQVAHTVAGR